MNSLIFLKKNMTAVAALIVLLTISTVSASTDSHFQGESLQFLKSVTIPFVKNMGQVKGDDTSFYADIFAGRVEVSPKGDLTYSFPVKQQASSKKNGMNMDMPDLPDVRMICEKLVNGRPVRPLGMDASITKVHFFTGSDPKQWKTCIPSFNRIRLKEVYPGVTLDLSATGSNVEKIFTVNPGADADQILIEIEGSENLAVDKKGFLRVTTHKGSIYFTPPVAFQEHNGSRRPVCVAYRLKGENRYGFEVGDYDDTQPLIIDPLLAATYFGEPYLAHSWFNETMEGMVRDADSNIYVTGSQVGDISNVVVLKFSPDLSTLIASTTLGGCKNDDGQDIALDSSGNVFVTGGAMSTPADGFPVTTGAYDTTHAGGFIAKLNSDLGSLLACTYIGGSGEKCLGAIEIDSTDRPVVAGDTEASDMPSHLNAYDDTYNGGSDLFVAIYNNNLTQFEAGTYIGGVQYERLHHMALDASNKVYLAGFTNSSDYPVTQGAEQTVYGGGDTEAVFSRLNASLTALEASTFLGRTMNEQGKVVLPRGDGSVFALGMTESADFPTTTGCFDDTLNGKDIFITRLDTNFDLISSTFLGGYWIEEPYAALLDGSGNLFITGTTFSSDFPITAGAYSEYRTDWSGFIAHVLSDLTSLISATYFPEHLRACLLGDADDLYVGGFTDSWYYPTVPGSYDMTYNGGRPSYYSDIVLARLTTDLSLNYATGATISGKIIFNGMPLKDVTVAIEGPHGGVAVTDENGEYEFVLRPAGNYTLTPSRAYHVFDPENILLPVSGSNKPNQNFKAAYQDGYGWIDLSEKVTPATDGTSFSDVCFVNDKVGWITSSTSAEIYHTTDGGMSFELQTPDYPAKLYAIEMQSATQGYAVGEAGCIFMTTDGGANWNMIGTMGSTACCIDCPPTGDTCYAGGQAGRVAAITGTSISITTIVSAYDVQDIYFPVNSDEGWACLGLYIYHYQGESGWANDDQWHGGGWKSTVFFIDNNNGWFGGDGDGRLSYTHNGGNWYSQIYPDPRLNSIYDLFFLNENVGWAVGLNGTILHTTNGGGSLSTQGWELQADGLTGNSLRSVHFTSATNGYAVGNDGVFLKYGRLPGTTSLTPVYLLLLD